MPRVEPLPARGDVDNGTLYLAPRKFGRVREYPRSKCSADAPRAGQCCAVNGKMSPSRLPCATAINWSLPYLLSLQSRLPVQGCEGWLYWWCRRVRRAVEAKQVHLAVGIHDGVSVSSRETNARRTQSNGTPRQELLGIPINFVVFNTCTAVIT